LSIDADNLPDFVRERRDRLGFPLGFAGWSGDFAEWRAAGLAALRSAVGPALDGDAAVEELSRRGADGSTGLRLRITFPTGAASEALMLVPDGPGPHPAILLLHDHGSEFRIGKEKVIAPWDDPPAAALADAWQARLYAGTSLGHALAARGYAVVAADALGWGSRLGNGYAAQQALAANLMQVGLTLAGVVAAEDAQLARWMLQHPLIDARRVGVMGFSFGGFRAWQAAALCPDIAAGVAAGWMGRLAGLMVSGNNQLRGQSAYYMLHPALGGLMDYPDVAGLSAPRPMQFLCGASDRHFPHPAVESAYRDLRRIWSAAGAPDSWSEAA
jgi:dienelactone hydrolase